jgi:hypothetical protein
MFGTIRWILFVVLATSHATEASFTSKDSFSLEAYDVGCSILKDTVQGSFDGTCIVNSAGDASWSVSIQKSGEIEVKEFDDEKCGKVVGTITLEGGDIGGKCVENIKLYSDAISDNKSDTVPTENDDTTDNESTSEEEKDQKEDDTTDNESTSEEVKDPKEDSPSGLAAIAIYSDNKCSGAPKGTTYISAENCSAKCASTKSGDSYDTTCINDAQDHATSVYGKDGYFFVEQYDSSCSSVSLSFASRADGSCISVPGQGKSWSFARNGDKSLVLTLYNDETCKSASNKLTTKADDVNSKFCTSNKLKIYTKMSDYYKSSNTPSPSSPSKTVQAKPFQPTTQYAATAFFSSRRCTGAPNSIFFKESASCSEGSCRAGLYQGPSNVTDCTYDINGFTEEYFPNGKYVILQTFSEDCKKLIGTIATLANNRCKSLPNTKLFFRMSVNESDIVSFVTYGGANCEVRTKFDTVLFEPDNQNNGNCVDGSYKVYFEPTVAVAQVSNSGANSIIRSSFTFISYIIVVIGFVL